MAAIEVDRLTVRYGEVEAVRELSFAAEAGEVTCIVGRNGAGKTSAIECLEGIRRPASGRLSVIGSDPAVERAGLAPQIGVMLQEGGIHPAIRVGEAVRHAAGLYPRHADPAALLEQVGLVGRERHTFRRLSGGEQRRLALALALVGQPRVAFLDEPTAGVDPEGRVAVREIVAGLRDDGVTVLLSSHELDEVERVADRVVVLDGGRLLASGTVENLTSRGQGQGDLRFRAVAGLDVEALAGRLGVPVSEPAPGEYVVGAEPAPQLVAEVTGWLAERDVAVGDLRGRRETLEAAFLRLLESAEP